MKNFKNIISKVKETTASGLPFMEGREKGEVVMGAVMSIIDFGYLQGEDGEFAVFITKEDPKEFFFGGGVVTQKLKDIDAALTVEEKEELLSQGLEVVFMQRMSKNKKRYTTCDFFPSQS